MHESILIANIFSAGYESVGLLPQLTGLASFFLDSVDTSLFMSSRKYIAINGNISYGVNQNKLASNVEISMKYFCLLSLFLILCLTGCVRYDGPYFYRPASPLWHQEAVVDSHALIGNDPATLTQSNESMASESDSDILELAYATPLLECGVDSLGFAVVQHMGATVYFSTNQTLLKEEFMQYLNSIGQYLAQHPQYTALIQGHTDATGTAALNLRLSKERAESLKQYLMLHWNIEAARIEVEGLGQGIPVADNATAQGRSMNRRAEIAVRRSLPHEPLAAQAMDEPSNSALHERLQYASGATQLDATALQSLQRIQEYMAAHPDAVLVIQGHADAQGDAERNYFLSDQRAQQVLETLNQRFHISRDRMRAMALGEDAPIAANDTAHGRSMNRRVEISCGSTESIGWDAALLI